MEENKRAAVPVLVPRFLVVPTPRFSWLTFTLGRQQRKQHKQALQSGTSRTPSGHLHLILVPTEGKRLHSPPWLGLHQCGTANEGRQIIKIWG